MFGGKKLIQLKIIIAFILLSSACFADNHNLNKILELIQKDLKTLEKAVYSGSINLEGNTKSSGNENIFNEN